MKKFLWILLVLALPAFSFAEPEMVVVPGPDARATPKSSLPANDLFHVRAHTCAVPSGLTCGPDNVVPSSFGAHIRIFLPTTQVYTFYWIFTDTEGNAIGVFPFNFSLTGGTTRDIFLSSSGGLVPTAGLYKFISVVVGANGIAAFSDYYRFRVLP